jgi:aminopeptidase N
MESKAADHFNPGWKVWLHADGEKERAMDSDARSTTHPIQQPINDESQIDDAFDDITYLKGQAFIRMLEAYLGEPLFRDGMRRYMKEHAYSNTTSADLWSALEEASDKPVAKIAATFTEQPGIPLIHVETRCAGGRTVATLKQDRFTIHDPGAAKLTWAVPVAIGRVGDTAPQTILVGDESTTASFDGCTQPVKANYGDVGYYRVQYDKVAGKALDAAYARLAPADRVNLLADSWAMVESGRADVASYLDLTHELGSETEFAVWTQVIDAFTEIDRLERGSPGRAQFRAEARKILEPEFARIGWDAKPDEPAEAPLARSLLIRTLGRFDDQAVVAECHRRFTAYLADPSSLPPGLQEPVASVVGYGADPATYDALRRLGREATGTEAKLRYYRALAGASDPALIQETVDIAKTDELPNGRVNRFLVHAADASDDPDRVWKIFMAERAPTMAKLTDAMRDQLLPQIAAASANPQVAAELKASPEATHSTGARYEVRKAAEDIAFKADFKTKLLPAIAHWLAGS